MIGNENSHKVDFEKQLIVAYCLCKSANYQLKYLRESLNKDYAKRASEASAKNNWFCSGIEKSIPNHEMPAVEEIVMQVLEKINEIDFNQKIEL